MHNAPKYKMGGWQFYEPRDRALRALGDWRGVGENLQAWMQAKDSLASASSASELLELQTRYDVDRLRFESQTRQLRFVLVSSVCGLLLAILVLLGRYSRRLRRKNRELVRRIREQEAAESEAETAIVLHSAPPSREEELFRQIQELMQQPELLAQPKLGRDELASMLGTNRTYVAEAIRVCTSGLNVSEYINRVRVKQARRLLENHPRMTLDEVTEKVGFASRSRFHTVFRDYYNLTPGEFRRAIKPV